MPTPPSAGKSYTSNSSFLDPSLGVKVIVNLPAFFTTKSVALYWSPKAWRPTTMGYKRGGRIELNKTN